MALGPDYLVPVVWSGWSDSLVVDCFLFFVSVTSTETAVDHHVDELCILCKDDGEFALVF